MTDYFLLRYVRGGDVSAVLGNLEIVRHGVMEDAELTKALKCAAAL